VYDVCGAAVASLNDVAVPPVVVSVAPLRVIV